ncbi:cbb3-type cytochrome c oxidase subunit I [Verrucomicrobiales bacterium]|jgi:cytochrome c oxidase cbb3-type subunit 1|nr:cbb3-type cytochrome c oxidase subunit I [Verrucomicrobiales bacterium]MDC0048338.1 cbb3-type cytochrome c oxidase subunit I [Verrucomicrobiota bacterium]
MPQEKVAQEDIQHRIDIDRSARFPVLFFITSAAVWLAVAVVLGFVQQMKLHSPGFLDHPSLYFLNYGRSNPAFMGALVYGWAIQAGIGVCIWLMARLCSAEVKNPITLIVAGHFWNLGVLIGVLGILTGHGTSIEWLAFPKAVWPILCGAFSLIVIWLITMFHRRQDKEVYISVWYILGACFWFPWIFITTNLFIHIFPGSAVAKAATNAWFMGSMIYLVFAPIGLASAYYIIPKIIGRPVHSAQLGYYGFWGLAVFGGWTGIQKFMGGPLPAWMPAVSGAAVIFMLIPVLIVTINQLMTLRGNQSAFNSSPALRFTIAGISFFVIYCIFSALSSFLAVGKFTQLSLTSIGTQMLAVFGFFSMTMFGAIYFIIPRLTGSEWPSLKKINSHFIISIYAMGTLLILNYFGGVWQSSAYAKFDAPLENAISAGKPYAIGASVAWVFILFSTFGFLLNLISILLRSGRREIVSKFVGHQESSG